MSVRIRNVLSLLSKVDHALEVADKKHTFENGLGIAKEIIGFLGIENVQADIKSFPRLKANPSWTKNAPDYEDRKASFALAENNDCNIDFKLYWVTKPAKRIISNLVALTPNFEDEAFYSNKSVGIDFILPDKADRLIVVLSSNYKIRILEIHRHLSNTQKKIFEKWAQDFDFSNKAQVHKILWDSFDIQPLNKEFYLEISSFFNEFIQHLEKEDILDKKHRSQFVNRLIGRIIFCWFLRKKEIISEDVGYFDTDGKPATEYYGKKLEVLFFKVLNTPLEERGFGIDDKTPFLNGGLFEEKESDLAGRGELSFPPDYFERFYSFLNRYNFTTDESTSDFQQVAIDPEMLGRIFENLLAEEIEETGEQARKAKGAFYTPREIVDYMCRESLRAYVSEKIGEDVRKSEVLQLLFDKKEHELDPKSILGKLGSYKNKIIEALDEIKIIDSACGSGAFPIGMLQIMLSIYERLDARLDHYKTKLTIIKNNIFGVDIEPMAVEISRLRTWLSLVVDAVIKPSEKNKGIEELPNLDFKFMCANSLISLEQEEGLFDNKQMAEQMQAIRERYFKTNNQRIKDKMKRDFEGILKNNRSMFASEKQKQLLTYHPFSSDNVAQFFDSDFIFGIQQFDIVIANPPYIEFKRLPATDKSRYQGYVSATGKYDIYVLFIERGCRFLKDKGILTYINPTTFMKKDFGSGIRSYLVSQCSAQDIVDFADIQVFESAMNYTGIFILKKSQDKENSFNYHKYKNIGRNINSDDLSKSILSKSSDNFKDVMAFKNSELSKNVWNFQSAENSLLISKVVDGSKPLSEYAEAIFEGIASGKDDVFYINSDQVRKLALEKEMVYPLLKGKDVKAYCLNWSGYYVVYPYDNDSKVIPEATMKAEYPNTYKYLVSVRKLLLDRGYFDKSGKLWYELWNQRKKANFKKLRIVVPEISERNNFALTNQFYGNTKTYHIMLEGQSENNYYYFLGLLNSSLIEYYYKKHSTPHAGGFYAYKTQFLQNIPIKEMNSPANKVFIGYVKNVVELSANAKSEKCSEITSCLEKINEMVMDLYGLTKEERSLINDSYK